MSVGKIEDVSQVLVPEVLEAIRLEVAKAATRASWPKLVSMEDLGWILDIEVSAARRRAGSGEFGEIIHQGRRRFLLRENLLAALKAKGVQ
ncbi:MAG: hypothetical protein K8T20_04730 [Planctomycetes bacterium]|nr:hypothetical protein [Planctomycetota bacterium]